jgi:hypothetical protein
MHVTRELGCKMSNLATIKKTRCQTDTTLKGEWIGMFRDPRKQPWGLTPKAIRLNRLARFP